jgi:hypothetical protein
MQGILGALGRDYDDPRTQGLLTLGLQLLASRQPKFGQALGEAGLGAMQAYEGARAGQQQRKAAQLQQQAQEMQLQRLRQEQERQAAAQAWAQALPSPEMLASQQALAGGGGPTVANAQRMPAVDPRLQMLHGGMRAGAVSPMEYMGAAFPAPEAPKTLVAGGNVIQVRGNKATPLYEAEKGPKMPEGMRMGPNGPEWIPGYLEGRQRVAASGATRLNVPINTERSYAGAVADAIAKQDTDAIDAARSAPERVRVARQVKSILTTERPITGTLAEQRLMLNKALATAGLVDGDQAAATEALASTLASQALAAIKTSGLGAGSGFSNADRDFLERAAAGKIDMTSGALQRLADLNERAAIRSIERGNKVIERLRVNPSLGSVAGALEPVEMPAMQRLPTASEIEAEMRRRGMK